MLPKDGIPLLVFGGPYSNLQATEAVLGEARRLGVPASNIICTGDVVAYAGDPEPTSALVRASGCHVIAGNCEEQLAGGADDCGCGFAAGSACDRLSKSWYEFANAEISRETRTWMAGLPTELRFVYAGRTFCVVHATAAANNTFLFASQTPQLDQAAADCQADLVLAGHCGLPFVHPCGATDLDVGAPTWVNAGVVGVPANDGTASVWYALITPHIDGARRVEPALEIALRRLDYDVAGAAAAIRRGGHALPYADALETGHWPSLDVLPERERAMTGQAIAETTVWLKTSKPVLSDVA